MADVAFQTDARVGPPPFADGGFAAPTRQQEFTLLDVTQAASRVLDVGVNEPALGALAGQLLPSVNQQREFRRSGLDGSAFRQLLLQNLTPDVAKLVDPSQAQRLRKEQAAVSGNEPNKKPFDPFVVGAGRMGGAWAADRGSDSTVGSSRDAFGNKNGGSSAYYRYGYDTLALASPLGRMGLTPNNFANSSLGKMSFGTDHEHLSYGTVHDLQTYDRHFTGGDVKEAASENKKLGFSVNDKPAMRDQATIGHYDKNAKASDEHVEAYQRELMTNPAFAAALRDQDKGATPEIRKAGAARVAAPKKQYADEHHVTQDGEHPAVADPKMVPRVKAAHHGRCKRVEDKAMGDIRARGYDAGQNLSSEQRQQRRDETPDIEKIDKPGIQRRADAESSSDKIEAAKGGFAARLKAMRSTAATTPERPEPVKAAAVKPLAAPKPAG